MIPRNARAVRITAAAGTNLAGPSSGPGQIFLGPDRSLHPEGLHPSRGIAPSRFRALRNIRYCSLPKESGQCLSPDAAGHALTPASRLSLGEPLPHQQADSTFPDPRTADFCPRSHTTPRGHQVLLQVSPGYP